MVAPRSRASRTAARSRRTSSSAPTASTHRCAVLAAALSAEASDPVTGLARYERTRRPRAGRVVLTSRERGLSNHLTSRWAAWRRDLLIAWRRRTNQRDPEGRGASWLADYDASSPEVLAS